MVDSGGTATYGINYYNLGKLAAAQAVEILVDGKDVGTSSREASPLWRIWSLLSTRRIVKPSGLTLPEDLKG